MGQQLRGFSRFLSGALLFSLPAICLADLSTSVSVTAGYSAPYITSCVDSGVSMASCSQTSAGTLLNGDPFTFSMSGLADAAYGTLLAKVNASVNPTSHGGTMLSTFHGTATASFSDILTVLGGSGTGYISYFFDGSITSITQVPGDGFTVQQDNFPPGGFGIHTTTNAHNQRFNYQTPFYAFTFGVPFTLSVSGDAFTQAEPGDGSGTGAVSVNLYSIAVVNQNRDAIPYSLTSQSGTVYAAPEPSSLALAATLAILAGAIVRKRLTGFQN